MMGYLGLPSVVPGSCMATTHWTCLSGNNLCGMMPWVLPVCMKTDMNHWPSWRLAVSLLGWPRPYLACQSQGFLQKSCDH